MTFDLNLHPPTPSYPSQDPSTYHPGQTLSGTLIYSLDKQRTLNSITLTLRGKLETNYVETRSSTGAGLTHGPRRPMQEIIRLFTDTRTLFSGPYDVPAQKFKWDFQFVLPREVEHTRTDERGQSRGFIDDGWGALPPSFEWVDRTISHDASVRIKYKLVATVSGSHRFGSDDEKEWPILVRRLAEVPEPEIKVERVKFPTGVNWTSHKLRAEGEKLSVRQRMRSIVSDDPELRTPGIKFKAWIGAPKCFSATQKFGIEFGIMYEPEENDPTKPQLVLDYVKLGLKASTQAKCKKGGFVGMMVSGERQCQGQYLVAERTNRMADGGAIIPLDGEAVYVGEVSVGEWRNGEVADLMGNFMTWTVKYGYWFSVEASVKHVETGKSWTLSTGFPVELRDAYVPGFGLPGQMQHPGNSGDVLPAYGDDVQPPAAEGSSSKREDEERSRMGEKSRLLN